MARYMDSGASGASGAADDREQGTAEALWLEAETMVRSEVDADVLDEARGLVIAEMSSVSLADRLSALEPGAHVQVRTRDGGQVGGEVDGAAGDHLLVAAPQCLHLVPALAIAMITDLPRVAHAEAIDGVVSVGARMRQPSSWRRVLRDFFGHRIAVSIAGSLGGSAVPLIESGPAPAVVGTLTWVGSDHVTVVSHDGEVTLPWDAITCVRLPRLAADHASVTG